MPDAFTLRIKETFRKPVEKHTSVYAFQRRDLCIAQISLLLGTTAVRGGSDTSRTVFCEATTQMHRISNAFEIGGVDTRS